LLIHRPKDKKQIDNLIFHILTFLTITLGPELYMLNFDVVTSLFDKNLLVDKPLSVFRDILIFTLN